MPDAATQAGVQCQIINKHQLSLLIIEKSGSDDEYKYCKRVWGCTGCPSAKRRVKSCADTLPMEQNTSFSAEVWIINQRTKRAFKRVYLSIVAHPKWKCLWWYIYENTIFMMIVGMNVCSPNNAQSFYFLPQRNTRNKTFFNHDAQAGISSFSLLFRGWIIRLGN